MYGGKKCCDKSKLLHYLRNSFHSSTSRPQCYYATLGIVRNASEKDIRSAYLQMAKKFHPDVNTESNATQKFSSINEAYSILSDKGKKEKYDSEIGNLSNNAKNWWDFNFYGRNTSNTNANKSHNDDYDDFDFAQDFYGDFSRFTAKNKEKTTHHQHNKKRNGSYHHQDGSKKSSNPYADYYYFYYEQQANPHSHSSHKQSKQFTNIWSDFEFDIDVEEEFDSEFNNEAFWKFIRNNNKKQRAKHHQHKDKEKENGKHNKQKQQQQHVQKEKQSAAKDKKKNNNAQQKEENGNKKTGKKQQNKKEDEVRRANDIEIDLKLDFLEAAIGCTKTISFKRNEICTKCGGTTYETSIECQPCLKCDGKGYRVSYAHDIMCSKYKCVECSGRGIIFKNCTQCTGNGTVRDINKSLSIRIPSGIRENDRVRVSKQGHQYHDAYKEVIRYGHIVINCKINSHEYFERHNNDIYCTMNIPYCLAVLGGTFVVPTIYGPVIQKVAAPIQQNHCLQIDEKGIYDSSTNKTGHMFVYFMVHIPQMDEINHKQKQLLNEYAKLEQPPTPIKMQQHQKAQHTKKKHKIRTVDNDDDHREQHENDLNDLL